MERTLTSQTTKKIGEKVKVAGWVNARRDHGKLIFIDLRDTGGVLQVVFGDDFKNNKEAQDLRSEWVLEITGEILKRPDNMVNADIPTGTVELKAENLTILNKAETPPFDLTSSGEEIGEEHRLKYRYLDLRRERMQKNIRLRHQIAQYTRQFLGDKGFVEIETPLLTKSTPEGARDFIVPSRKEPGKFYALPQSPQQYKQLLMVSGFEKYFQLARALRDEDTRGDRQPEHTQIDIEISFVTKEEVLSLVEELITEVAKKFGGSKKIKETPFPRISYKEAMESYGSDRPDLRKEKTNSSELAFAFVTDFPMFENKKDGSLGAVHHPFTKIKEGDTAEQYDLVLNGEEIGGGSIREHDPKKLIEVFKKLGHKKEDIEEQFGHLLGAFSYGVPPHGGIAIGLDRLVMVLAEEPNIREVIAFPKTGDGRDLMMNSPSKISSDQLEELGIEIKKEEDK